MTYKGAKAEELSQHISNYFSCPVFVERSDDECLATAPSLQNQDTSADTSLKKAEEQCHLCSQTFALENLAPLFPTCSEHGRYCWECLTGTWRRCSKQITTEWDTSIDCPSPTCSDGIVPMWAIRKCIGEIAFERYGPPFCGSQIELC